MDVFMAFAMRSLIGLLHGPSIQGVAGAMKITIIRIHCNACQVIV
jgi:hypothetical protein